MNPDDDLVRRIKKGDREAFDRLIRAYDPKFRALFNRISMVYGIPLDKADDVMQEVYMALWRKRLRLVADNAPLPVLLTYVRRMLVRQVINLGRKERRAPTISLSDSEMCIEAPGPNPEVLAELREHLAKVDAQASEFTPDDQEILKLKSRGTSDKEIAELLGLSPGAVRARVHRRRGDLGEDDDDD